jgi:dihydrodiol dehydrogenase / D-xylose 1-dehydrogenase (NADP)
MLSGTALAVPDAVWVIHGKENAMMDRMRWGIMATGGIAQSFVRALAALPEAEVLAVGSRSQGSADDFALANSIPRAYASYEALVADPDIDIVYIATPHAMHHENTLLALAAGKHVLVEKAFALNAEQAAGMIEAARDADRFLMEAMWSRFIPALAEARARVQAGDIGEVRMVTGSLGFRAPYDPAGRLFNPDLAGGALLDVGVYPITLAEMFLGLPDTFDTAVRIGETGVDEQFALLFHYEGDRMATLHGSLIHPCEDAGVIMGTEGMITLHPRWHHASAYTIQGTDGTRETIRVPYESNGLNYEAGHVMARIRDGHRESDVMPLSLSLDIMDLMDTIRAQWGLVYPQES